MADTWKHPAGKFAAGQQRQAEKISIACLEGGLKRVENLPTVPAPCTKTEKGIAVFGGTFDPIHRAHLEIIAAAWQILPLRELILIPTYMPPHKRPLFSYSERCQMIERVIGSFTNQALDSAQAVSETSAWAESSANKPQLRLGTYEQELYTAFHPEAPYFVAVARLLARDYPDTKIYLLLGEDAFVNFRRWYGVEEIIRHCTPVVFPRVGVDVPKETYTYWQNKGVPLAVMPIRLKDFASLKIRQALLQLKAGRCVSAQKDFLRQALPNDVYDLVLQFILASERTYPNRYF